jgi:hypothetical protein
LIGPHADRGIIELDDALKRLAQQDQRKSDLIELLFFGGLTYEEAAEALKIQPPRYTENSRSPRPGFIGRWVTVRLRRELSHRVASLENPQPL